MGDKNVAFYLQAITPENGRVILSEAKNGQFMDEDIPETDQEIIDYARYWFEEAYKGYENGMRLDTVISILNVLDAVPEEHTQGDAWKSGQKVKKHEYKPEDRNARTVETPEPRSEDTTVAAIHNLPIPQDWEGDLEEMPRDISEITDKEVRRLSGAMNAYLSRVKWLLALEISDLAAVAHLRDAAFRKSLKNVDKVDKESKKTKLKELIDAEAKESPEWLKLDELMKYHQKRTTEFKALQEIYSGNIDRLSREWTMRQDEYEKTSR